MNVLRSGIVTMLLLAAFSSGSLYLACLGAV